MKAFFAALFSLFFLSSFTISGDSMEPFLSHDDLIFVESYGYFDEEPQRGDVIVFYGTDEPDKFFVKRIVGMPGETILLSEDIIYLVDDDGTEIVLEEPYLRNSRNNYSLRQIDGTRYEVPYSKYFVLGDNRNSSFDSRTWNDPFVPKKSIVGKYHSDVF